MTAVAGLGVRAVDEPTSGRGALLAYGAAGCAAAAFTAFAVWESPVVAYAHSNAVLRAAIVLALAGAAVFTRWRRPSSPLGIQIGLLGALYAVGALNSFADPAIYTVGRLALAAFVVAFAYVALAFPYGRIDDPRDRLAFAAVAGVTATMWLLLLVLAVRLPRGYMLSDCAGTCPRNPLALGVPESVGHVLAEMTRIATVATTAVVAVLLFRKLRRASSLPRRGYALVLAALVATACAFVAYGLWQPYDRGGVRAFQAIAALAGLLVPLALVGGQVRAHVISVWSLRELMLEAGHSQMTLSRLQALLRRGLGDPTLTVRLWDAEAREYLGVVEAGASAPPTGRVTRPLTVDGTVLGVVEHDALVDDVSGLAQAVATASLACFPRTRLLEELRETRRAARTAVDERIRLERDLHDGATQRALGLQLGLAHARAHVTEPELAAELDRLSAHAAALRGELRDLAHGIYPPTLLERGIADALAEATAGFGERVRIHGDVGRLPPLVEHELYLCTLEAVQNVVRHGGARATADVALVRLDGLAQVVVSDDGVGFDAETTPAGVGLASMRDRVAAVGGTLEVASRRGAGTRVRAAVALEQE